MHTDFEIAEIKFGPFAGWWVRDEAHRLGIISVANELGGEYRELVKKIDAIRVCHSDRQFEDLQRLAGLEAVLAKNVSYVADGVVTLIPPEGEYL